MWHRLQLLCLVALLALPCAARAQGDVRALAYSPDGRTLAVGGYGLALLDAETLKPAWRSPEPVAEVRGVAFAPKGDVLAAAQRDKVISLWAPDGRPLRRLEGHGASVNAAAFFPAGDRIASASSDKTVRVWDVATGKGILTCQGHTGAVHGVAVSPDGARIASASADGSVRLWDAGTGKALQLIQGHTSSVWSVAFSPDGRHLASGSWDMTVRVWDVATGRLLRTLRGHEGYVRGVAFSPDGVHLASASWDRSVRVWDLAAGKEAAAFRGPRQPAWSVAFRPDGTRLASGSLYEEEPVRLWKEVPHSPGSKPLALAPESAPAPPRLPDAPVVIRPGDLPAWRDGSHPAETRAAIQKALDAARAPEALEPVVTLPPGEYLIGSGLSFAGVTLRGPGATIRVLNETSTYLFGLSLGERAHLEEITVVGDGPRCVPVRLADPAREVILRGVRLRGGTILLDGQVHVENVLVEGCVFEDGGYGLLLDQQSSGRNVRVVHCTFRGNRSDAIELNFPRHREGKLVEDVVIADNVFENTGPDPDSPSSGFGVGIAGARSVQITGNTFRRMAVQAVHLEDDAESITISGNNMLECGLDHTGGNWTGGVHVLSGSRHITVSGNNLSNCRYGVSGLQDGRLQWCAVTGNTFRNCEKGLWAMLFPRGVVQGNLFDGCQVAVEIWRTPFWSVTGNQMLSTRPGSIGVQSTQFRHLVLSGNTIQAETPVKHLEEAGDLPSLIERNLILDAK